MRSHHCPTWEDPDGCRCISADTVAMEGDALAKVLYDNNADLTLTGAKAMADALIKTGIFLDAAAVRHKHGERIARQFEAMKTPFDLGGEWDRTCDRFARSARDLSPPP